MAPYQRRLPHWQPEGKRLFVTWRLRGSIPPHRCVFPQGLTGGWAFVWMDRYLDQIRYGPRWLQQPRVAQLLEDAVRYGETTLAHYLLHAYVILPNHVHLLLLPLVLPSKLFHSLKGFTAREANKLLRRSRLRERAEPVSRSGHGSPTITGFGKTGYIICWHLLMDLSRRSARWRIG